MFGHDSIPSIVYSYGARRPVEQLAMVREQMHRAHRYRNALVALEHERRARVDAALAELCPDLRVTQTAIAVEESTLEGLRATLSRIRAGARKRTPVENQQKAEFAAMKARLKELRARRKALRAELFGQHPPASDPHREWTTPPDVRWTERQDTIETWYRGEQHRLRAESGLTWGTYLHVETSLSGCRSGAPPRFARWDGSGHLAIQIQGGATWDDLTSGTDTRLRLVRAERAPGATPGSRRDGTRYACWWRIASHEDRTPYWTQIPVVLHREVPGDARVKWAHLLREVVGTQERWDLQLVISREAGWAKPDCAKSGACGLDIGWRMTGEGLRVAVWVGDDGKAGDLVLPQWWLDGWTSTETLRGRRDGEFGAALARLADWLGTTTIAPEWLRTACDRTWTDERGQARATHIRQWREQEKLLRVWREWRGQRFAGDEVEYSLLTRWALHEMHLHDYEDSLREQLQAQRLDLYRRFVARLRRRYRTVAIERRAEMRLDRLQERPQPEEAPAIDAAREHQRDACCHVLRGLLAQSVADLRDVEMDRSTMECHACGHASDFARADVMRTCPGCGDQHDQDENAGIVLLRRGTGGSSGPMLREWLDPLAEMGNHVEVRRCKRARDQERWLARGAGAQKTGPLENVDGTPARG